MNKTCPKCQTPYNINEQLVGRTFTCQRCQSPLIVQPDGLQIAGGGPVVGALQPPTLPSASPTAPAVGGQGFGQVGTRDDRDEYEDEYPRGIRKDGTGPSSVLDYLLFRRMIVPIIIQILFWLTILSVFIVAGVVFFWGVMEISRGGIGMILVSPVIIIFGFLLARIYAELTIIIFRINETLTDIRDELRKRDVK